jgi:deoxyribonuclease V
MAIQRRLAGTVRLTAPGKEIRLVAGVDAAFSHDGTRCIAAAVLWDAQRQVALEERIAERPLTFPYVPGLLSFREAPAVIAALRKLRREPDAIMCDAHGLAHPTVGCAKSPLVGNHGEPARKRGSRVALRHEGERVGTVLRTRDGVRPVYVSVGHRIDLETAERIVLQCGVGYRLPEPTRLADRLVARVKRAS